MQNYAYGGATAIIHDRTNDDFTAAMNLDGEIYAYLAQSFPIDKSLDKSSVLYSVWIGANDYLYDLSPDTETLTNNVIDKISSNINFLIHQGAKNFLIVNMPDLSRIPYAKKHHLTYRLHLISQAHNEKLTAALTQIQLKNPDVHFITINIFDILNDILDHTDSYNQNYGIHIQNITQACWTGGMTLTSENALNKPLQKTSFNSVQKQSIHDSVLNSPVLTEAVQINQAYEDGVVPCANPDDYFFWDEIHPAAVIHDVMGRIAIKAIEQDGVLK